MFRKTFAEIDCSALRDNIKTIRKAYPEYDYCIAVVKGNAYGHGMYVVNDLIAGGANYLAVATLEEAVSVREQNADIPLLCLEPLDRDCLEYALRLGVTLTVDSERRFSEILSLGTALPVKIHIKIDTGMNRLGIKDKAELERIFSAPLPDNIKIEGIYTHLATSGVNDIYYDRQYAEFERLVSGIDLSAVPIVHIGRSLTLVHRKKPPFVNGIRLGICMYGFAQSIPEPTGLRKIKRQLLLKRKNITPAILENNLSLKTAFRLYSEVLAVKTVKKGEFVGYGASYIAKHDMTVATVAIGYFDGMPDRLPSVVINGKPCEVVGELCMDMTLVSVPEDTSVGDRVEIFGETVPVSVAARRSGQSAYRLLTGITNRVLRVYDGREIKY